MTYQTPPFISADFSGGLAVSTEDDPDSTDVALLDATAPEGEAPVDVAGPLVQPLRTNAPIAASAIVFQLRSCNTTPPFPQWFCLLSTHYLRDSTFWATG
ncbi:hypothetical protein [Arthrobacter sp. MYb213]|uniref:hypothetical protein n=1 Tax=Arthrobacter sp. MYb213 TaxID=1848595 RepID=UPI000CFBF426|nr:hypothetical protein [Arthrobacter sp. MYb213]PRB69434.1 hypothetical protein CQ011_11725 [Arthrobacter sp. MYb213]